jgi:protein SCO1
MKNLKWCLLALFAIASAGVMTAITLQKSVAPTAHTDEQRFYVRGEVRGIEADSRQIRIKHEKIPNYMAAMTMPFDIRNGSLLNGLKPGDQVGFELIVTKTDSWVASINKLSESRETAQATAKEIERVQVGEVVPDFSLIDQRHHPVRLKDFRGQVVLLTFIYTRCPLPNYCPLMSSNVSSLQERLEKKYPGKFHLLSVSIDPEFDEPEVLEKYGSRYSKNEKSWSFATGTREQSDAVGELFGLVQERTRGLINHDLRTALIAADGRLVHVWKSNVWTPYEVQRRVEELFDPEISSR